MNLSDNEIIKALECCGESKQQGCLHCPISDKCLSGKINLCACVLDLINRKNADVDFYKERANKYAAQVEVLKEQTHQQQLEIDILIRKKETLRDEIAEQQAEFERLKLAAQPYLDEIAREIGLISDDETYVL